MRVVCAGTFAPGVGKTFSMLAAARRLKAQGVEVVVGLIEAHGRSETAALVEGLDVLPRRLLPYPGRVLEEFDLEKALQRRPKVLLLDELAHTNVAGSRHRKQHEIEATWPSSERMLVCVGPAPASARPNSTARPQSERSGPTPIRREGRADPLPGRGATTRPRRARTHVSGRALHRR